MRPSKPSASSHTTLPVLIAATSPAALALATLTACSIWYADRYVLWDKMGKGTRQPAIDDDAAEGRTKAALDKPLLRTSDVAAVPPHTADPASTNSPAPEPTGSAPAVEPSSTEVVLAKVENGGTGGTAGDAAVTVEGEPEQKKVKLSGAQKKALAKQRAQEQWEAKKKAKAEAKAAAAAQAGQDGEGEGKKKLKGQNKVR